MTVASDVGRVGTAGTKRRRMHARDRRKQIVEIAADLFARNGFNGTTTREIAEGAGVSEAIIFRHFPGKEALYSAIIDFKTTESREQTRLELSKAARRKDDRAFFRSLAFSCLEIHRRDPSLMRLLFYSALEGHKLSELFFKSAASEIRDQVRKYIRQRITDGAFRDIDPNLSARAFVGMIIHHAQIRAIFGGTSCDDIRLGNSQLADRLVDLFLRGVRSIPDASS